MKSLAFWVSCLISRPAAPGSVAGTRTKTPVEATPEHVHCDRALHRYWATKALWRPSPGALTMDRIAKELSCHGITIAGIGLGLPPSAAYRAHRLVASGGAGRGGPGRDDRGRSRPGNFASALLLLSTGQRRFRSPRAEPDAHILRVERPGAILVPENRRRAGQGCRLGLHRSDRPSYQGSCLLLCRPGRGLLRQRRAGGIPGRRFLRRLDSRLGQGPVQGRPRHSRLVADRTHSSKFY